VLGFTLPTSTAAAVTTETQPPVVLDVAFQL
jgi:hypothetical protein